MCLWISFILLTSLAIFLPIYFKNLTFLFTYMFGIVGVLLRYLLNSINSKKPHFPFGTFLTNVSGTWILGLVTILIVHFKFSLSDVY